MYASALLAVASAILPVFAQGDLSWHQGHAKRSSTKTCTVTALGGGQDDGPNIINALSTCKKNSIINLSGNYTVGTMLVAADLDSVEIKLSGTMQYTNNIDYWSPNSLYLTYQNATTFFFLGGKNIYFHGPGTIDANGQLWWETFATNKNKGVAGGSSTTFARPIPLTIGNATNVVVDNLRIIQSPFWHNFCYQSKGVTYSNIHMSSVSSNASIATANSDGIDIYRSSNVHIRDWIVNNQDDCVSFKPNSTNVLVERLNCNGSHGISVGSLGQYKNQTDIVANIHVEDIIMSNAENGARIKVFPDSPNPNSIQGGGFGYVKNITFKNFENVNVDYPILINQCYNIANATFCAQYPSKLSISDVHYINVHGTSSGRNNATVVQLECSAQCTNITATKTNLRPMAYYWSPAYWCRNIASLTKLDFKCTPLPAGLA